jgi:hypothetical protein
MTNIKLIHTASQALIYKFKNTKTKIYKCNANIHFNRECLKHNLVPKYITNTTHISITHYNQNKINNNINRLRLKEEIKLLYLKKQHLNKQLYYTHIQIANTWGNNWNIIEESINEKINIDSENKYKNINKKVENLKQYQTPNPTQKTEFYPRVINNTNITFTNEELNILNQGSKYNTKQKPKNWIRTLALEAETAINELPITEQDYTRWKVANTITKLYNSKQHQYSNHKENKTLKAIKTKLQENKATITRADKGNTIVIIYQTEYNQKIKDLITSGQFNKLAKDPNNIFQKSLKTRVKKLKLTISNYQRLRLININPKAPNLKGLIKLHK